MPIPAVTAFPAVVIGGGISGLFSAYRLQQAGVPVLVLEAGERTGGVIRTVEPDGFRIETGPQSFLSTAALLDLIERLDLNQELLRADPHAPRYILLRGELVPAPLGPSSLLTTRLLGLRTKWRILSEPFRHTTPPAARANPANPASEADADESVASFVRRKFTQELSDRLVGPFVSGIYAGDPEKLSLRAAFPALHEFEQNYGSIIRGQMKSRGGQRSPRAQLCSFREGMEALPRALTARLGDAVHIRTSVTALRHGKANGKPWFEVDIRRGNHVETLPASTVILASPAYVSAELVQQLSPALEARLLQIEYAPVAVVATGYRNNQISGRRDGFGFLVPRTEGLRVLGTVWNSSLFPERAPAEMSCFTSFAGGATDPGLCSMDEQEIAAAVSREVEKILGISEPPVTRLVQRYTRALPQYNLGHVKNVSGLNAALGALPGFFLTGNYLTGPSLGSCLEQATRTAEQVRVFLTSAGITAGAVAHA